MVEEEDNEEREADEERRRKWVKDREKLRMRVARGRTERETEDRGSRDNKRDVDKEL